MAKRETPHAILLVEGPEDKHVIQHLSTAHGIVRGSFEIVVKEGYENLLNTLDVELDGSELQRLGIVVDADLDITARWYSLRNRLQTCGYASLPQQPQSSGIIINAPEQVTLGIWVMPNNQLPGMLEDFVTYLVPSGDPLWERAKQCAASIPAHERRFATHQQVKAEIHTWLAWQEFPGTPLGLAITRRYFDSHLPLAQQFSTWLKQLFSI